MSRSVSRGRDNLTSSGRGGTGNFRSSTDVRPEDGPDDFSLTRGREQTVHPDKIWSTGRGGAGNIRASSHEPTSPVGPDAAEQEIIRQEAQRDVYSTGRGGAGNMSRSRSGTRDPTSIGGVYSTGRGGLGNFKAGEEPPIEEVDHHDQTHSFGRGGVANHVHYPTPGVEHPPHEQQNFISTGRGGHGNIVDRSRSASRDPNSRSASKDKEAGVAGFLHKMSHMGSKEGPRSPPQDDRT